jgi:hypothetical protein
MRPVDKYHRLLIMVDGPDGSGKAELKALINQLFDHQVFVIHSALASSYVLDELLHRSVGERRNYVSEIQLMERAYDVRQVICFAAPIRCLDRQSPGTRSLSEFQKEASVEAIIDQTKLFGNWASLTKRMIPTIQVWTDGEKTMADLAKQIHDWIVESIPPVMEIK